MFLKHGKDFNTRILSMGEGNTSLSKKRSRSIKHVVVLGANGSMGYGCAALFSRAVPRVTMLARNRDKAAAGLTAAIAQVRSATVANRVEVGTYDDAFEATVSTADLIFETVAEDMALKQKLFEQVDRVRKEDSIVGTVSSGLSINQLCQGRSDSFARNFMGLHFFNPPNAIVGMEIIKGDRTDPGLIRYMDEYCRNKLGRVVVLTSDGPGFAGNRIGFKVMNEVAQLAAERGVGFVDRIAGPYTGRMMTLFETADMVGWDVHKAIVDNIYDAAPDEARDTLKLPDYMNRLIAKGRLGEKTGGGFYKSDGQGGRLVLDPQTGDYRPEDEQDMPGLDFIDQVAMLYRIGNYKGGAACFLQAKGEAAALARKIVAGYISYAFHRAGEVADMNGIDLIMAYGFNWAPPSVLVDTFGLGPTLEMMDNAGVPVPGVLNRALSQGRTQPFFSHPQLNTGRYFVAG